MPTKWPQILFKIFAIVALTVPAAMFIRGGHILAQGTAQDVPAVIGRIEGESVEVKTTTPGGVELNDAPTVVGSGSDVTLRSGHAMISLNGGGEISVCGPAHFTMLKSAGAVTLALDYGRIHPALISPDSFTIYTPTIIATPISISGTARDATLGLSQTGEMCLLSARGALRVEPQFAGQSLIVPQGGAATLESGQVLSGRGNPAACSCDVERASRDQAPPAAESGVAGAHVSSVDFGALAHPSEPAARMPDVSVPPKVDSKEEPIYTVLMPPLRFDANSPIPAPDPSPETILLVREVRLRPDAVFRGHVDPAPAQKTQTASTVPPAAAPADTPPAPPAVQRPRPQPGVMTRMWNYLRGITNKTP
jgi:hypothetical protein